MSGLPQPPHYQVGGALQAGALYVERRADKELLATLKQGDFCYVLGPRQIGKSSLRLRAVEGLREIGVRSVAIDLSAIGIEVTQDDWYFSIAFEIAEGLGLPDPDEFWQEHRQLSAVHRWYRWIRNELLAGTSAPVVVFIDEVDSVLALSFPTDDFFASIRAAYNLRADNPAYRRLTFCLLGVAAPGDLIQNPVRTPFNIGRGIRLDDFSRTEMEAFGPGLAPVGGDTARLLDAVYAWSSGHPYMTQRLCDEVRRRGLPRAGMEEALVDDIAHVLFVRSGRTGDQNLQYAEKRLDMSSSRTRVRQMLHLYRRLLDGEAIPAEPNNALQTELRLMGIATEVVRDGEATLRTRNLIFAQVYDHAWLRQKMKAFRLAEHVERWSAGDKHDDYVLRGHALQDALNWSRGRDDLTLDEHEYILAGVEFARREAEQRSLTSDARRREEESRRALLEEQRRTEEERYRGDLERERRERAEDSAYSQRRLVSLLSVVVLGLGAILVSFGPLSLKVSSLKTELTDAKRMHQQEQIDLRDDLKAAEALVLARQPSREVDALVYAIKAASGRDLYERPRIMQALVAAVATPQPDPISLAHPSRVNSLAFSSDGSLLLTTSHDKRVRLWDTASGASLLEISGHRGPVRWAMFSPDQRHILSASDDRSTRLWELHTGIPLAIFRGQPSGNRRAIFSQNLDRVLTISQRGEPQLWDPDSADRIARLDHPPGAVHDVALSPDGERIATGHADGALRVWDGRSGRLLRKVTPRGAPQPMLSVAFSPDGELLLTRNGGASTSANARLWEVETGELLEEFMGHEGALTYARMSSTGRYVITLDERGGSRLWRSNTGSLVGQFTRHPGALTGAAFTADDSRVVTYGVDGTARIWKTENAALAGTLVGHTAAIRTASFSPDGLRLVTASADSTARLWNALNGAIVATLDGHEGAVRDVKFSPDGSQLATVGDDYEVRLWSTTVVNPLPVLSGHTAPLRLARYSPDGARIVTAGEDRMARLWDANDYSPVATLVAHSGPISAVVFAPREAPNREYFLTMADGDPTVHVWGGTRGEAISSIPGDAESPVQAASFTSDGAEILTTSRGGITTRWDVETGKPVGGVKPCVSLARPVHVAVYSDDGRFLLTAGRERGDIQLLDTRTCEKVTLIEPSGRPVAILRAVFAPGSDKVVAITADHRAHLWRVPDGAYEATITMPGDSVLSAAFEPNGLRLLLTGRMGGGEWSTSLPHQQLSELPAQPGPLLATRYSRADTRLLVTAGGDTTARLWLGNVSISQLLSESRRGPRVGDETLDPAYSLLATFRGHRATITSVDFSPDGSAVITAGRDGVARIFPTAPETYLQLACRMLHGFTGPYQEVEAYCRSL